MVGPSPIRVTSGWGRRALPPFPGRPDHTAEAGDPPSGSVPWGEAGSSRPGDFSHPNPTAHLVGVRRGISDCSRNRAPPRRDDRLDPPHHDDRRDRDQGPVGVRRSQRLRHRGLLRSRRRRRPARSGGRHDQRRGDNRKPEAAGARARGRTGRRRRGGLRPGDRQAAVRPQHDEGVAPQGHPDRGLVEGRREPRPGEPPLARAAFAQQLAAQRRAQQKAQRTTTHHTSTSSSSTSTHHRSSPAPVSIPANSSRGAAVVAMAMRYLGVPYVYGGMSPRGFDCSGLVGYVYKKFGITWHARAGAVRRHPAHLPSEAGAGDSSSSTPAGGVSQWGSHQARRDDRRSAHGRSGQDAVRLLRERQVRPRGLTPQHSAAAAVGVAGGSSGVLVSRRPPFTPDDASHSQFRAETWDDRM